jgi:LytS/YehU family sensor histidine kinase
MILREKLFRTQMNPHFLFNSLTSIQNYILDEESRIASKYLSRFSKLIRNILDSSSVEFVSLEKEISTIENFLELQKIRFRNKFDYSIEVDQNINLDEVNFPPMIAQPFIENAIEHGIKNKPDKGHIDIRFMRHGGQVILEVEDDGVGREKAKAILHNKNRDHKSLSTEITRERIRVLNKKLKKKITLDILDLKDDDGKPAGTKVVLEVPLL